MKKKSGDAAPGVLDILKKYNITLRQKYFCDLYMQDETLTGNGAGCYAKAYNKRQGDKASRVQASYLLANHNVRVYCNSLRTLNGFDDASMDKNLNDLAHCDDPAVRREAIKEYNRLKRRISDKLLDLDANSGDITINITKKYAAPDAPGSDAEKSIDAAPAGSVVTTPQRDDAHGREEK